MRFRTLVFENDRDGKLGRINRNALNGRYMFRPAFLSLIAADDLRSIADQLDRLNGDAAYKGGPSESREGAGE